MKIKIQFFTVLCIFNLALNAQQWYPDSAKWRFNKQELLTFPAHGYIEYKVANDTSINDTTAKLITVDTLYYNDVVSKQDTIFVYASNSKVYYWNGCQFKLMYDFSKEVGDTLSVHVEQNECDSVSPIIIDSVSHTNVNGQELQVQHVSYTLYAESMYGYNLEVNNKIIEKIGYEEAFIYSPECIINDEFVYSGLRCYKDDSINYTNEWWGNHFPNVACDSIISDTTTEINSIEKKDFFVYPNPFHDFITISTGQNDVSEQFAVEIYNTLGKKLDVVSCNYANVIDLSDFQSGIYFLKIYQKNNRYRIFKVIKK
jgi:hypothetical protein